MSKQKRVYPPLCSPNELTVQIESYFLIGSFKIDHCLTSLLGFCLQTIVFGTRPVPDKIPEFRRLHLYYSMYEVY